MTDDVRQFDITVEFYEPGAADRTSKLALRRSVCASWYPSAHRRNTTVVNTLDGKTHRVNIQFTEFHAWAIGPAAEQDKQRSKR